ncbi:MULTISPECIES: hypothetical protein [unclassified Polaromonas]|jgi:hypothetical protein|uniref:hypothetical protein n=1 Tax=unclassified Polaromonas TaxID=2638319 RepID=UPI000BCC6588|nr:MULTISPECIES: hypothetical protein [unclassified Polaromonas]OYY34760.1 MAG: hypothetical protein B7Y60_15075 [Polaromonas sp. 35-63-35]OYZ19353.1 MAG: hypothetical protein B7Y28_12515 [Polaromonas sp. 16-63-31]OYZ77520.1 MAG: hypothetical protein B7Y09_16230 [Polaromonas sp. 24-63-21]OZA48496.1 MAG: hypothetical protein B7X88_18285 [Polaromonas sp. 17-63-33]OZA87245.1 MAG: hypothetical protein B7X65_13760 [Polaromonas sp. 39-63-25]
MSPDLFGYASPRPAFKDIGNQRDTVAEEKAILCKQLGELFRSVPKSIQSADIKKTREWMHHLEMAKKVLASSRSSRTQLQTAVDQMRSYIAA